MQEIIDHTIFCYDGRLDSLLADIRSSFSHLGARSATWVQLGIVRLITVTIPGALARKELIVHSKM